MFLRSLFPQLKTTLKSAVKSGYPKSPQTIGEHIRKRRMDLQLKQEELAVIFDVSTDTITNWENNRSTPQISYYPALISFLGYLPTDIDASTFGGRIMLNRYLNGHSHSQLGKIIGADPSTIASWENNEHVPQGKHRRKLMQYLEAQGNTDVSK